MGLTINKKKFSELCVPREGRPSLATWCISTWTVVKSNSYIYPDWQEENLEKQKGY